MNHRIYEGLYNIYEDNGSTGDFFWDGEYAYANFRLVPSNSIFKNADSSFLDFDIAKDIIECRMEIFSASGNILGNFSVLIRDNVLKGNGRLYGNKIDADIGISISGGRNNDDLLVFSIGLNQITLSGSVDKLLSDLTEFIRSFNDLVTHNFGFQNVIMRIHGESCIFYKDLDFEGIASIEFESGIGGERDGQIYVDSGSIYKFGKRFNIDYGLFDFETGAIMVNASHSERVYIREEDSGSSLQNFQIKYKFWGMYPDSLELVLDSEPPMKTEEIISLLIWGDPASKRVSGIAVKNMEDRIKLTMENYNSERFTRMTERQVGRLLAFDRVVVEGNSFSFDSPIQADKDLNRRLRLSVRGTVGGSTKQTVSFDYRLINDFFLINETSQDGDTGLDLRYIIRFK